MYRTEVWISDRAKSSSHDLLDQAQFDALRNKLIMFARVGFGDYEGEDAPIRHEFDGAYRIAPNRKASLFRLAGFYSISKCEFIITDAFMKHGQGLRSNEHEIFKRVAQIRTNNLWEKRIP